MKQDKIQKENHASNNTLDFGISIILVSMS